MASLKVAASLINELSQDTQLELYKSWQHNQEAAVSRLVEIAKEKGQTEYDTETVKRLIKEFIAEVQKNDENEDLELKEEELVSVAGGGVLTKLGYCVEEDRSPGGEPAPESAPVSASGYSASGF